MRALAAILLTLTVGCAGAAGPPAELAGLWGRGEASCAAGMGVRFAADGVWADRGEARDLWFADPHYEVLAVGDAFKVRISYALPSRPGGVDGRGGRGAIVVSLSQDGRLNPVSHSFIDHQTGAARVSLQPQPIEQALQLSACKRIELLGAVTGQKNGDVSQETPPSREELKGFARP